MGRRTLLSEEDWGKLCKANTDLKLRKNAVKFTPYGTAIRLPVMGRAKVVMQNQRGKHLKTMVYVVQGQTESLLGKRDAEALGILQIALEGAAPSEQVNRITPVREDPVVLSGVVSENQTQAQIDKRRVMGTPPAA